MISRMALLMLISELVDAIETSDGEDLAIYGRTAKLAARELTYPDDIFSPEGEAWRAAQMELDRLYWDARDQNIHLENRF